MTIFRIIRFLELRGHRCTIWFSSIASGRSTILIRDEITKHFQTLGADIKIAGDELFETSGDAIVATGWQTVPFVAHSQHFKRRFYFVQDFEPAFYPAGSHSAAAEETYRLGLDCICASPWLEKKMIDRGMWARSFLLAADLDVYHAAPRARRELPKIAFYYRHSPRRLPELGLLALEELARRGVRFEVHSFGTSEPPTTEAPFLLIHPRHSSTQIDRKTLRRLRHWFVLLGHQLFFGASRNDGVRLRRRGIRHRQHAHNFPK